MRTFFNIRYEFDREAIHRSIEQRLEQPGSDYICVADGVILNNANTRADYLEVVNGGMFAICDSSYVPMYINWIHGEKMRHYTGSEIFENIVSSCKYRMIFLGANQPVLDGLRERLALVNPDVNNMRFVELPFLTVEEFDYPGIARMIEEDHADIVWVAMGAPKQEYFMAHLKKHLNRGVMIAVGAAFKFYSGVSEKRAPQWMQKRHLEFVFRLGQEPRKQIKRCYKIVKTLPGILADEWRRRTAEEKEQSEERAVIGEDKIES